MVSIYALASVSGANFNPAVTLTLYLTGVEKDITKVAAYMGTQIVAGICAGFTYFAIFGKALNLTPGTHDTHGEFGAFGAGVIEILYTFVLCFVVLRGAVIAEKNNESFGMAIAFSVVAGGYAGGWISGGCFNPAVAIGLDVSSAHMGVKWCLLYTLFEFIGPLSLPESTCTWRPPTRTLRSASASSSEPTCSSRRSASTFCRPRLLRR